MHTSNARGVGFMKEATALPPMKEDIAVTVKPKSLQCAPANNRPARVNALCTNTH